MGANTVMTLERREAALDRMIEAVLERCLSWLGQDEHGNTVLVDPHEGEAIGAHYALSHFAAATILGFPKGGRAYEAGVSVLCGVLSRWGRDSQAAGFHNDFNNFALCKVERELEKRNEQSALRDQIRRCVLSTPDSNHDTVNWIPMRLYVNRCRRLWTGEARWSQAAARCEAKISKAINVDGFIEDRLPKGVSFNLQYDVATVAMLRLLEDEGFSTGIDLGLPIAALCNAVAPDGDINYLGRGCNQVFAWGPWLYALRSCGLDEAFDAAAGYLASRLDAMLLNENLLLNELSGADRQQWWDYHFCSVYTAHLLLWLVLARRVEPNRLRVPDLPSHYGSDSGVSIMRSPGAFAVTFSGRREYLSECGPVLSALWTQTAGMVHKGEFGPWLKAFGFKHASLAALLNHFGLIRMYGRFGAAIAPVFAPVAVSEDDDCVILTYHAKHSTTMVMNMPLLSDVAASLITVLANGVQVPLRRVGTIVTQYGEKTLLQSSPCSAKTWEVRVTR